jgi:hypothetical protein
VLKVAYYGNLFDGNKTILVTEECADKEYKAFGETTNILYLLPDP